MLTTFPTNPEDLINAIEEDAPAVYEILMEEYHPTVDDRYPSREDLTTILENYSGNNYDTHWWNGRWSILKELINPDACNGDNGTLHIAGLMNYITRTHYGYHLIRCEVCDTPHRLHNEIDYLTQYECDESGSTPTKYCQCGQTLNHDNPDLFY